MTYWNNGRDRRTHRSPATEQTARDAVNTLMRDRDPDAVDVLADLAERIAAQESGYEN